MNLLCARARRKYKRGQSAAELRYLKKLRKAKANAVVIDDVLQKPSAVKTHMRNMTIVPEMVGCVCKVYSGCHYVTVEVKVCTKAKHFLFHNFMNCFARYLLSSLIVKQNKILICIFASYHLYVACNDRHVLRRVLHHLQARFARTPRYRCH